MKTISNLFRMEYRIELSELAGLVSSHAKERGIELTEEAVYDIIEEEYDLAYDNHNSSFCCCSEEEAQEKYDKDDTTFNLIILEIAKMAGEGIVPESFTIHNEW